MAYHAPLSIHPWFRRAAWVALLLFALGASASRAGQEAGEGNVPLEDRWPLEATKDGTTLIVHQPQIDSFKGGTELLARAATEIRGKKVVEVFGEDRPSVIGAVILRAKTETDMDARLVAIHEVSVESVNFAGLDEQQSAQIVKAVQKLFPSGPQMIPLDLILANIERTESLSENVPVSFEAPPIFFSTSPAILLFVDGVPTFSRIGESQLLYCANASWDLFQELGKKRYHLLTMVAGSAPPADGSDEIPQDAVWLSAPDLKGPWRPSGTLPSDLAKLPKDESWKRVREQVGSAKTLGFTAPTVCYADRPAELILCAGEPQLVAIPNTQLLYVANTNSDLFLHSGDEHYYALLSGRWFRTASLNRARWSHVANLPDDFASIPEDHERARVLVSVPGTADAQEAVLTASIPHKATVDRNDTALTVTYAGEPQFEPIEGTKLTYAVNTSFDVIGLGEHYYCCYEGIWFESSSPSGPWIVCDAVPEEIYTIPPGAPGYRVTYVRVYSSTPQTVVYGYTSGYWGVYYHGGVVVYGTGYYYPPYVYRGIYYPRYYTYGCHAYYNRYAGHYARGAYYCGPYAGYGGAAYYNPHTGTYARGRVAHGPHGSTLVGEAYNPWTGTYAATRQSSNPYSHWGQSVVTRGDEWVRTGHYTDSGGTRRAFATSEGARGVTYRGQDGSGGAVRTADGDLYVGRDGNVYRRQDGSWEKHGNDGWKAPERPEQRSDTKPREREPKRANPADRKPRTQEPRNRAKARSPSVSDRLERDRRARQRSADRSRQSRNRARSAPSSGGSRRSRFGGNSRGSRGASRGAARGGGRGRR